MCKEEGTVSRKRRFIKFFAALFWSGLVAAGGLSCFYVYRAVPDRLNVVVDQEESFHFSLPVKVSLHSESREVLLNNGSNIPSDEIHLQLNEPFSLYSENEGTYRLNLKLFGLLSLKDIEVAVSDTKYAIPCGVPIGIYMKSDGLMVIGTGEVTTTAGDTVEPADGVLKSGDYIEAINGIPALDKRDMIEAVNDAGTRPLTLNIRRDGEEMKVEMTPVQTLDGDYKLGLWIRDDTQGIGTMTYLSGGEVYDTEIMGIDKGTFGKPGVMSGVIYYGSQSRLGSIEANTNEGIFGVVNDKLRNRIKSDAVPVGYRQDVKKGAAYIRSSVSGEVKDYRIEIQKVDYSTAHKSKDMIIKVTDPELLALTGGIVQGMSGSPIIQDGKLIGAVTHVFIQDSTRGYGIFIENMLSH